LGHAHIICITVRENRIICCQIFCDLFLRSAFERIFNVMQLILVKIKRHKWKYLIKNSTIFAFHITLTRHTILLIRYTIYLRHNNIPSHKIQHNIHKNIILNNTILGFRNRLHFYLFYLSQPKVISCDCMNDVYNSRRLEINTKNVLLVLR
jgi:hypothetical protein